MQIVLMVSPDNRLLGTVTDGDIRRGLLRGEALDSPVERVANQTPTVGYDDETEIVWQQHIKRKSLRHLPILNRQKQLVGLYYHKTRQTPRRKNPVVLMLGGLGMRLRPLTETVPKPMLPVGNQPILETIVKHIAEQGFTEFYFCINYLGEKIRAYFGDGSDWGVHITYVEEPKPLGTAGALSLLPEAAIQSNQPMIVMNGDLLTKIDFRSLLDFHQSHGNGITTCVREYSHQVPYGVIELEDSTISQLVEKPTYRYFVNAGIYCLSPQMVASVPVGQFYDMPELIETEMAGGTKMGGFPLAEYWMDIGHIPDYEQAQADYEVYFK
ncbi:alcohol dehydrogenase [Thiomicrospira sp. WB1]|nr:alcohol dehydrogenase [Thiomicrospira sp. WB1]